MAEEKEKQTRNVNQQLKEVDYKDVSILKQFLNPYGRMLSRRRTGVTAKNQRKLARAVKRARFMGLLPYVSR